MNIRNGGTESERSSKKGFRGLEIAIRQRNKLKNRRRRMKERKRKIRRKDEQGM